MILDLLKDHGITPAKKAGTHGGEYASPCPACGGRDRFVCWPDQGEHGTWWCRGCDKGGDAIEFLRAFDGLSFAEACARLGIKREYRRKSLTLPKTSTSSAETFTPKEHSLPPPLWREKAATLLAYAQKELLANDEELAKLAARGLPPATVERFGLGWLPGERVKKTGEVKDCYYRVRSAWGLETEGRGQKTEDRQREAKNSKPKKLWFPRGLVVPALGAAGEVLRLRIRRPDADRERFAAEMKYVVIPGSFMGPLCLPPAAGAGADARAFVVVESELDAMACQFAAEEARLPIGALAVGTNLGKPDAAAHALLAASAAILVALDFDQPDAKGRRPGAEGVAWWRRQYRQAERWPTPVGKDVGEMAALGKDVAAWLQAGLPPRLRLDAEAGGQKTEDSLKLGATRREGAVSPSAVLCPSSSEPEAAALEQFSDAPAKSYVVTLTSGAVFHITADRETWNALIAAGEIVFSQNELALLGEACGAMDEAARLAALEKVLAIKRAFASAYIRDGRSSRHRRACGVSTDYFLCPPVETNANNLLEM